jgi:hypothetical protein
LLYLLLPSQFPFPCLCPSQFICLRILLNGPLSKLHFTFMGWVSSPSPSTGTTFSFVLQL